MKFKKTLKVIIQEAFHSIFYDFFYVFRKFGARGIGKNKTRTENQVLMYTLILYLANSALKEKDNGR